MGVNKRRRTEDDSSNQSVQGSVDGEESDMSERPIIYAEPAPHTKECDHYCYTCAKSQRDIFALQREVKNLQVKLTKALEKSATMEMSKDDIARRLNESTAEIHWYRHMMLMAGRTMVEQVEGRSKPWKAD